MDLETRIVAVSCLVDDFVRDLCHDRRLRQRGPTPVLADSEVLTVEIVGEFLGLDTDRACTPTSGATTATCSRVCGRSTAPPSPGRRPTCGWSSTRSGDGSPRWRDTIPRRRSATA